MNIFAKKSIPNLLGYFALLLAAGNAIGETRTLKTMNSAGRSGVLYIPSSAGSASGSSYAKRLPLMVAFHGQGGNGQQMVQYFQELADSKSFLILAPDSRKSPSGDYEWQVGTEANQVTPDLTHSLDCIKEVQRMTDVLFNPKGALAVGFSSGGSQAPYLATHSSIFSAFGSLHGGAFPDGFGSERPRGWFSTGTSDDLRPADGVKADADSVRQILPSVVFKTYAGGHVLSQDERADVIEWWLSGSTASSGAPPSSTPTSVSPESSVTSGTKTTTFP